MPEDRNHRIASTSQHAMNTDAAKITAHRKGGGRKHVRSGRSQASVKAHEACAAEPDAAPEEHAAGDLVKRAPEPRTTSDCKLQSASDKRGN